MDPRSAIVHPNRVQGPTHDVVPNPGKILHSAAPHKNHRMLLEIVADARDVRRDFDAIGQPHAGDLS